MKVSPEQALVDVDRAVRATFPERAEDVLRAIELPAGPSPTLLACIEAAKAGAKFRVEHHGGYRPRRGSRRGSPADDFTFDSRDPDPPRPRLPDAVAEANKVTYETVSSRVGVRRRWHGPVGAGE